MMIAAWFLSAVVTAAAPPNASVASQPLADVSGIELTADINPAHGLPAISPLVRLTITNRSKSDLTLQSGVRAEATRRGGPAFGVRCGATSVTCGHWSTPWFAGTAERGAISLPRGRSRSMYFDMEHMPFGLDPNLLQPGEYTIAFVSDDFPAVRSNTITYTVDSPTGEDLAVWHALTPSGRLDGPSDSVPFLREDLGDILKAHPSSTYARAWGIWDDFLDGKAEGDNFLLAAERWVQSGLPESVDQLLRLEIAQRYQGRAEEFARRGKMDAAQASADTAHAMLVALQKSGSAYASDAASATLARGAWTPVELDHYREMMLGSGAPAYKAIDPHVDCVVLNDDGTFTAWFGYSNRNANNGIYGIPVGPSNRFSAPPEGRGQPTSFYKGDRSKVFSVTAPRGEQLVWLLDNKRAVASANEGSSRCAR